MSVSLSPITLDVLAHAANRWAYNHLPGAEAVAQGSTDPLVCAHVARALLETLTADVLRHEYGLRGVRTVRGELKGLVGEAEKSARAVIRSLARQDADEHEEDDPYRQGAYRQGGAGWALHSWLLLDRALAPLIDLLGRPEAERVYRERREAIDARAERDAATAAELGR